MYILKTKGDGSCVLTNGCDLIVFKGGVTMPRAERKTSSTNIYHVMLRGINKQLIFEEEADYRQFLNYISEVKKISGFKLFAYCLSRRVKSHYRRYSNVLGRAMFSGSIGSMSVAGICFRTGSGASRLNPMDIS